jgi:hypothetical protein
MKLGSQEEQKSGKFTDLMPLFRVSDLPLFAGIAREASRPAQEKEAGSEEMPCM